MFTKTDKINPPSLTEVPLAVEAERFVTLTGAIDSLKAQLAVAREALITGGEMSYSVSTGQLTVTDKERRNFDTDALANLVSATIFDKVTTPKVVVTAFDAAREVGLIDRATEDAVVTGTEYTEIRVTG